METSLLNRVQATLLALATAALFLLAVFNFLQERQIQQPDDGVWWSETQGGLQAVKVQAGSPGQHAYIQPGDLLTGVSESPTTAATQVSHVSDLERALGDTGSYGQIFYAITRDGIPLETPIRVVPVPADRSLQLGLRVIGLIYLFIGFYVLFRRWGAPRATHFYLFCLVSFALYALKYTSALDTLDWTVFWTNVVAEALQPALFLHFALSFPEERLKNQRRWLTPALYAPGAGLLALWIWSIGTREATKLLLDRLNQIATGYDALFYVGAAVLFLLSYRRANTPLLRQQLKWVTRGTLLAVVPFTVYAICYLLGLRVSLIEDIAGASLVFLPLTFSWAIVRYRLMDTDLIFKRGVAYMLATGLIVGGYVGTVALISVWVHNAMPVAVRETGLVLAIVITALVFDPLKRRVQGWVDRAFDRHRYDYRKALVEFGRGLSSETNLQALLGSIVEQLPRTLLVARVAIFLAEDSGRLRLAAAHGLSEELAQNPKSAERLDLGFLDFDRAQSHGHIFLENAQQALHLPAQQQRAAALLDLNYYLPCRVAQSQPGESSQDGLLSSQNGAASSQNGSANSRTIAVIGLGRTLGGDFLSSEDVELLESLASYIGIALQNASLYARLGEKITEFERLKEFNENIVESINVGIFAVDLDDRIESWNAQMEAMYALSRAEAIGQQLRSVFPLEFIEALEGLRSDQGVHHLYKFRLTTRADEQRTANIAIAPLLSRDFVPMGRIILVDDITERVTLESQLAQADKLSSIGLLAAGVAHEINTPLAVISSYAQMLSKQLRADSRSDARLGPVLDKITQQSFRAAEIANGLLNFSRTSTTEFRSTDLNQVIRDTLSLLEHQFKTAQILVDLDLTGDLPPIHGNQGKLQQVFLNLLLNAKEAMPGGGRLRVATLVNGHVEALVSDSGSGIAPEHLKRIYDPFFTTKTRPGDKRGTGLGLAVSYGIIQEHAGKIHVESAVGSGTTFHLEFPLIRNSVHA
jgi:two-component system, NtrC family, sensor kinase